MSAHRTAQGVAIVEALEGLQAALVVHVGTVQQVDLALTIQPVRVVADGAVFLISRLELVHDGLPVLVQFLLLSVLIQLLLPLLLPTLIPDASHVGNEGFQEFLSVFDRLVHTIYRSQDFLPFLRHDRQVPLSNSL